MNETKVKYKKENLTFKIIMQTLIIAFLLAASLIIWDKYGRPIRLFIGQHTSPTIALIIGFSTYLLIPILEVFVIFIVVPINESKYIRWIIAFLASMTLLFLLGIIPLLNLQSHEIEIFSFQSLIFISMIFPLSIVLLLALFFSANQGLQIRRKIIKRFEARE